MAGKTPKPSFEGVATTAAEEEARAAQDTTKKPATAKDGAAAKPKVKVGATSTAKKAPAAKAPAQAKPAATKAPATKASKRAAVAVETTDAPQEAPEQEAGAAEPKAKAKLPAGVRNPAGWLQSAFPGHEHAAMGGLVGLVLALCVFLVGFWQTLFVSVLVFVGIALGQYLDGDPKIINFIRRLIAEARGNE